MKLIKRGVEIFNGCVLKDEGHWRKLSDITRLDYLAITFLSPKRRKRENKVGANKKAFQYEHFIMDGQRHYLSIGFIEIMWGGYPYTDWKV